MPIYEYRCSSCGSVSEYLVGVGNGENVRCKACDSEDMVRILSPSSYAMGTARQAPGQTCCGREERCDTPPCSGGGGCRRG